MSNKDPLVSQLFIVLRRKLKAKSLTYRDIAYALNATDVSVKRWFSEERLSVSQLSSIAHLLGLSLTELLQEAESPPLQQLTLEQETELVRDIRLFLVARCVLNKLTLAEIIEHYDLTEAECIQCLLRLDRLRFIDLLPENKIKLRISRDFDFLPNGPLKRFVFDNVLEDFLGSRFENKYDDLLVMRARLTTGAMKQFQVYARRLKRQLAELHEESSEAPFEERHGFTGVLMMREFESKEFIALHRRKQIDGAEAKPLRRPAKTSVKHPLDPIVLSGPRSIAD